MNPVSLKRHGDVAVITIDNPPVNALSHPVRKGLVECIEAACDDNQTQAIVLHCSGRTFIAGADIREFGLPAKSPILPNVVGAIEAANKPVVAAIHGTALGGGLEVAMACHYRIAEDNAVVGLPEVKLGLLPGATGTQRLPRLIGAERALELMLSGESISASAAQDAGLLDEVTNSDDLTAAAIAFARARIAAGPRRVRDMAVAAVDPGVFAAARENIARKARGLLSPELIVRCVEVAIEKSFDDGCLAEREYFRQCMDSPQSRGLRHAFFAEREAAKVPGIDKDTPRRNIRHIAVLGAGTMGAGIAYACLAAGYTVHLLDNDDAALARGAENVRRLLSSGAERGKLSATFVQDCLQRFAMGSDYADIHDADLIIEAVVESMAIKHDVFSKLDSICKPGAILASNTSTLDLDRIAAVTSRPADVIGLHFFSPAHIMRLLEIVRGARTAEDVIATALGFAKSLGKVGVVVGNCFGFVGNRMLYSYGRENQLLLLEGAAPEHIDRVLFDWGMAMGPNAVGDLAGLDVGYRIRRERSDLPDDPRFYRVADMLAEQGRYGQKTGKGMYRYQPGSRTPLADPEVRDMIRSEAKRLGVSQRAITDQEILDRCICGLVIEGARILQEGIAARSSDIDVIWINGYGFPRHRGGPMHFADATGLAQVLETITQFRERFGPTYWEPPGLLRKLVADNSRFADL
ncbi:MAG: 3-hydroxyacyl-CoA dehydrogenase NAD-binding domain-containing protein [Woeseia sp.]